ncbi:dihydroxyacid dehydratase/phosphogluconate dehydratase, partial [Azomonas macrocytogenes]|nr:dihydroxyacid dehydratase/phosphogluconate dehydratase [Azomonas macrocytogenes]
TLEVRVDPVELAARENASAPGGYEVGCGRELFAFMRASFSTAEEGASAFTAGLEKA